MIRRLLWLLRRRRPLPGPPLRDGFTLDSPVRIPGVTDDALPECPHGKAGPCGALPDALGGRWVILANTPHYYPAGRTVAVCGALRSPPLARTREGLEAGFHYRPGPSSPARCVLCAFESSREDPTE
jgi:hypothetical protein